VVALLLLGAPVLNGQGASPAAPAERHVLVVSVDGLGAKFFAQALSKAHLPNFQRLRREGSFAEGVIGVYPTVTYPSHTTLVTGRLPAEHGIYSNLSSREAGKNPRDWFWYSRAIQVPTLWDEARQAHMTTMTISWPVTAGAAIDWNLPEIWDPGRGEGIDLDLLAKYASPGLLQATLPALLPLPARSEKDELRTRFAVYVLKQHKPHLMLIHLGDLDEAEHEHGPGSAQAVATLEKMDAYVGELLAALRGAALESSTDVFIVSDHGFLTVDTTIRPNVLLAQAGLLTLDSQGTISGGKIATVANGGSFFIYGPDSRDLRAQIDSALTPLRGQGLLWAEVRRAGLKDLGADPGALLALEARSGAAFSSQATGAVVEKQPAPTGIHGYLPSRPELFASFVAWGPHIKAGVNTHLIPMTAIGPTILKAMGIDDPKFGSRPPLDDIFK